MQKSEQYLKIIHKEEELQAATAMCMNVLYRSVKKEVKGFKNKSFFFFFSILIKHFKLILCILF